MLDGLKLEMLLNDVVFEFGLTPIGDAGHAYSLLRLWTVMLTSASESQGRLQCNGRG